MRKWKNRKQKPTHIPHHSQKRLSSLTRLCFHCEASGKRLFAQPVRNRTRRSPFRTPTCLFSYDDGWLSWVSQHPQNVPVGWLRLSGLSLSSHLSYNHREIFCLFLIFISKVGDSSRLTGSRSLLYMTITSLKGPHSSASNPVGNKENSQVLYQTLRAPSCLGHSHLAPKFLSPSNRVLSFWKGKIHPTRMTHHDSHCWDLGEEGTVSPLFTSDLKQGWSVWVRVTSVALLPWARRRWLSHNIGPD